MFFGNWVFGPEYGFLNVPRNVHYTFNVDGLYENEGRSITYRRDDLGFRGHYEDVSKIDVLTIGGSTTNQLYIDDAETWQNHLRTNFAADGQEVTIVDAAIDGQSTRGHIAIFDQWLAKITGLKARYVLAYVGVNDIRVEDAELGDRLESDNSLKKTRHFFLNNSALYNLFRTLRGYVRARSAKLVHGTKPHKVENWAEVQPFNTKVDIPSDYVSRLAAYRNRLQVLIKKIRDFGAAPIIVTQHVGVYQIRSGKVYFPTNAPRSLRQWSYSIVRSFNNTAMEVCQEQKAICLDLAKDIVFGEDEFYDHVHNTPKGAHHIGRYLHTKLKLLIKCPPTPTLPHKGGGGYCCNALLTFQSLKL